VAQSGHLRWSVCADQWCSVPRVCPRTRSPAWAHLGWALWGSWLSGGSRTSRRTPPPRSNAHS